MDFNKNDPNKNKKTPLNGVQTNDKPLFFAGVCCILG